MSTVLLPPGGYPIAVNKCIISFTKRQTDKQMYSRGNSNGRNLKIFLVEMSKVRIEHNKF